LTVVGAIIGLIGAVVWAWPWPYTPLEMARWGNVSGRAWLNVGVQAKEGLYPWPVWLPLPTWSQPGGNWQTGLATGLAGLLAGTVTLRLVRLTFGLGMGAEYMDPEELPDDGPAPGLVRRWLSWVQRLGGQALGLGDADLMMMAGSFLGWQPILTAFLIGVMVGLVFGLAQVAGQGSKPVAFGPGLAVGVLIACLGWSWIGPRVQPLFSELLLMASLGGICVFMMVVGGYLIRLFRLVRHRQPVGGGERTAYEEHGDR
jgi:leader peptidase (prepilin peptidase)/N-methyltransferase